MNNPELLGRIATAIYRVSETYPRYALAQMNGVLAEDFARAALDEVERYNRETEAKLRAIFGETETQENEMDDAELRFSCLQLANHHGGQTPDKIVEAAEKFYQFARGMTINSLPVKKKRRR